MVEAINPKTDILARLNVYATDWRIRAGDVKPVHDAIGEIERLRAANDRVEHGSYDPTGDEVKTLRRALCNAGEAAPESDETLGLDYVRYAQRVIRHLADRDR